jgi:hypothetical protein
MGIATGGNGFLSSRLEAMVTIRRPTSQFCAAIFSAASQTFSTSTFPEALLKPTYFSPATDPDQPRAS